MFKAGVHAVWIAAIPIVESIRVRFYEYQDSIARPQCRFVDNLRGQS